MSHFTGANTVQLTQTSGANTGSWHWGSGPDVIGSRRPPAPRPRASSAQGVTREQDMLALGFKRYSCSQCQITYYGRVDTRPDCPLCTTQLRVQHLETELTKAVGAARALRDQRDKLAAEVEHVQAMRQAVTLADEVDRAWIKSVLYRYREDKTGIVLRAKLADGSRKRFDGFIVTDRRNDNNDERYQCQSMGGVALVLCFVESCKMVGSIKSTEYLMTAIGGQLALKRGD